MVSCAGVFGRPVFPLAGEAAGPFALCPRWGAAFRWVLCRAGAAGLSAPATRTRPPALSLLPSLPWCQTALRAPQRLRTRSLAAPRAGCGAGPYCGVNTQNSAFLFQVFVSKLLRLR